MNRIVIWGAGNEGKRLYDFLKYRNMENIIYGFCDNNEKLFGHKIGGKKELIALNSLKGKKIFLLFL